MGRTTDVETRTQASGISARRRVAVAFAVGVAVAVPAGWFGSALLAPLIAWCVAAATYLTWVWLAIWRLDADRTARQAVREDPSRAAADVVLLSAAVASLAAVAIVVVRATHTSGTHKALQVFLVVASVLLAWTIVHTTFTLRYAHMYYTGPDGGVNFNQDAPPQYSDFAYLAFTVGMTFQVSDTNLTTPQMRATALRHALLSYLFGAVILATTINLVAGLSR
ncbi:MAG TPA: DUF1345 domain-containing protein [Micromonosporaceae bacterium]